jgi:hypothetical protein
LHDNCIEKKSVEMNYRNYEGKIVEKYSVELKGWPASKSRICNPALLGGRQQLEKLLAALESGQCHWVVLTEDELEDRKRHNQACEERGEQVYRPRKSANHHTSSNLKGAKSTETIEDSDEEDDQPVTKRTRNDDEDADEQEHATKRTRSEGDEDSDNGDNNTAAISGDITISDDQDNEVNVALGDDQDNADNMAIGNADNTDNAVA